MSIYGYCGGDAKVADLLGLTMRRVQQLDDDRILFEVADGRRFLMCHMQDCCEAVYIESIVGDLQDLVDAPLLMAEEVSNEEQGKLGEWDESFTWTFYKFATCKGYVDIRWYGTSNGYYSESVDLIELREGDTCE